MVKKKVEPLEKNIIEVLADTPFSTMFREAMSDVERDLALEDQGWAVSSASTKAIPGTEQKSIVTRSRQCYYYYPLAKQGIRIWVNYTFGTGLEWSITEDGEESKASDEILRMWSSPSNACVFSTEGQYTSDRKLLVVGEAFFALFIGTEVNVRLIDPLEITEIITDPDDAENVRIFKRLWTTSTGNSKEAYYPSIYNVKKEGALDSAGIKRTPDKNAPYIYHVKLDALYDRGVPLLTPILDWLKLYRRFMASRVAIMLALARFAWKVRVKGGATAVATEKGKFNDVMYQAGSTRIENEGADLQPIKTDTSSSQAAEDGRQLKLLIAAGLGIPEQYFGDISTGNLATAKTVELPMLKQFQTHQQLWADAYRTLFEFILERRKFDTSKLQIDIDFPAIAPEDSVAAVAAINQAVMAFPEFASSPEVQKLTLINLGLNNTDEILDNLTKVVGEVGIAKVLETIEKMKEHYGRNGS